MRTKKEKERKEEISYMKTGKERRKGSNEGTISKRSKKRLN